MPETRGITLRAEVSNLSRLIDCVTTSAVEAGLDEDAVFHCHLAVDEATTNIIEHGYKGREPGDITLVCEITPDGLKITLTDSGIAFDMASVHDAVISKDLGDLQVGGLGLTIIRRVMDEVTLARTGEHNILTLAKRRNMPDRKMQEGIIAVDEIRPGII